MYVTQKSLLIYYAGQPINLMIDLNPELYRCLPHFVIPDGQLLIAGDQVFYVCQYDGNEWVFFTREIQYNNVVQFWRVAVFA